MAEKVKLGIEAKDKVTGYKGVVVSITLKSIRDIPNVFDLENHRVGGFPLSLNNMENNILRPLF